MFDPVTIWSEQIDEKLQEPAFQLDESFVERLLPLMGLLSRYFDAEVRGIEHVPEGPVLLVGNHSGGILTPDTSAFFAAWYREFGLERPLIGLAFDAAFAIPGFGTLMRKLGEIPANMEDAGRALLEGAAVFVYPGGDYELYRPWSERNQIEFNGHVGFIRLALEHGVPVVPVVGHGGHESTVVLTRGEGLARALRLGRLRMHINPLLWQIPWGVSPMPLIGFPLPAKITLQIGEPLDWSRFSPSDADDPRVLKRCYEEITGTMQATLTALAEERPYPVLSRLSSFLPGSQEGSHRAEQRAKGGDPMSEKKARRKLTDRVREIVDSGADTAEDIHRSIANVPLDVLERFDVFKGTIGDVRKVQDRSIGAVYELVRDVNRDVARLADELMKSAGGAKRTPARKRSGAKSSRSRTVGSKKATRSKANAVA